MCPSLDSATWHQHGDTNAVAPMLLSPPLLPLQMKMPLYLVTMENSQLHHHQLPDDDHAFLYSNLPHKSATQLSHFAQMLHHHCTWGCHCTLCPIPLPPASGLHPESFQTAFGELPDTSHCCHDVNTATTKTALDHLMPDSTVTSFQVASGKLLDCIWKLLDTSHCCHHANAATNQNCPAPCSSGPMQKEFFSIFASRAKTKNTDSSTDARHKCQCCSMWKSATAFLDKGTAANGVGQMSMQQLASAAAPNN